MKKLKEKILYRRGAWGRVGGAVGEGRRRGRGGSGVAARARRGGRVCRRGLGRWPRLGATVASTVCRCRDARAPAPYGHLGTDAVAESTDGFGDSVGGGGFGDVGSIGGGEFLGDPNDHRLEGVLVWASRSAKCRLGRRRRGRRLLYPPFSPGWWLQPGLKGVFSPGWWLQSGLKTFGPAFPVRALDQPL
jgi:hypothetical protein